MDVFFVRSDGGGHFSGRITDGIIFSRTRMMNVEKSDPIIEQFRNFISHEAYPCVAARAALQRDHIPCFLADHMSCPKDDQPILQFIYRFIDQYRETSTSLHSAAVIFRQPEQTTLDGFESMLWSRLQSLGQLDAMKFSYDPSVNSDPEAHDFSFSLGREAFFIIGLHPASERPARRFTRPAIIFNPHRQFEQMRRENRYEKMKKIVRKRDILYSGSINPMLADYGEKSEAYQYSGRHYEKSWTCPLEKRHATDDH